jgi:hypothetical protein
MPLSSDGVVGVLRRKREERREQEDAKTGSETQLGD